jgi:TolB-like protein/Tfp pilus assembly protein PilF
MLLGIGALFALRSRNATPGAKVESLAVMPFANGDGDPRTEYLSDGITESLIASLTHVPGLRVKSRSSVFHYRGKDVDLQRAGTALAVPALVTGRVVPRGDSVEVSAELVEVRDNTELWGQRYSGKSGDIITIEERIAGDLAAALRGSLTDSTKERVTRQGTHDREAYELYLRGRYAWNKRTLSDIRSSISYFEQAIAKDPGYAQAYSGLADAYVVLPQYADTSSDDIPKADAAARKALELDPALAHPHAVLGANAIEYHWDFPAGEAEFKRALALDESDPTAHQWYAECLALLGGREEEAIAENDRARALDPLSPIISASGGDVLIRAGRLNESVARLRTVLAEYPTFALAHVFLAEAYFGKHMYPEAIAEYVKLDSLSPMGQGALGEGLAMQRAYRAGGERAALRASLSFQREQWRKGLTPPYFVAATAAELGERDEAFRWLDSAYKARFWLMVGLKTDYQLDSLHSDPRFTVLARKIGLP